jgi:hypothetical protein
MRSSSGNTPAVCATAAPATEAEEGASAVKRVSGCPLNSSPGQLVDNADCIMCGNVSTFTQGLPGDLAH